MQSPVSAALLAPALGSIYVPHWLGCVFLKYSSKHVLQYVLNHSGPLSEKVGAWQARCREQSGALMSGFMLFSSILRRYLYFLKHSKDTKHVLSMEHFEVCCVTYSIFS